MITAVVLRVLIVLFAAFNSQKVTIHWIVTTSQTPMIVVIAGCGSSASPSAGCSPGVVHRARNAQRLANARKRRWLTRAG